MHREDCFLRLPCREELYENQDVPETPYLAAAEQSLTWEEQGSLGNMAYLIEMSSAWSEVLQHLYRTKYRAVGDEAGVYERFYGQKQRQLQWFTHHLPPHMFPCNRQNIERALHNGYIGTFISLHALYHTAAMQLNRHAVYDELEHEGLHRNLRAAQYHARELLNVTHTLSKLYREQRSSGPARIFSTPFLGYAILSAVDILTSIGTLADLQSDLQLVQSSLEVVQELSRYWSSAQKQLEMIANRFTDIVGALEDANTSNNVFITTDAMENTFGRELDLFFSPPVEVRLQALGLGTAAREGQGVLTIESLASGIRGYGH